MQTTFNGCKYTRSANPPAPLSPDQYKSLESKGAHDISRTIAKIVSEQFGKKDPVKFKLSLKHREITLITNRPDGVEEEIKLVKDEHGWKQGTTALPNSEKISKRVAKALRKIGEAYDDKSPAKGPSSTAPTKPELPVTEAPKTERIEALEREVAGLKLSIEQLTSQLKAHESLETQKREKEALQKRLEELEPRTRELEEQIRVLKASQKSTEETLESEKRRNAEAQSQIVLAEEKFRELDRQLREQEQKINELTRQNQEQQIQLQAQAQKLQAEQAALSAERTRLVEEHKAALAHKGAEISELLRQIAEKDAELKRLTASLAQNTAQTQRTASEDQQKIRALEQELQASKALATTTEAARADLAQQLLGAQQALDSMKATQTTAVRESQEKIEGLSQQIRALEDQSREMERQHAAALASAQANLEAAKKQTEAAKAELSTARSEKDHFERLYNEALAKAKQVDISLAQKSATTSALLQKEEPEAAKRIADAYAKATAALGGK